MNERKCPICGRPMTNHGTDYKEFFICSKCDCDENEFEIEWCDCGEPYIVGNDKRCYCDAEPEGDDV